MPAWDQVGAAGPDQRTPDLAQILQEIVDRPGWSAGNAAAIIVSGDGERTAVSHDDSSDDAPVLVVEYTVSP